MRSEEQDRDASRPLSHFLEIPTPHSVDSGVVLLTTHTAQEGEIIGAVGLSMAYP